MAPPERVSARKALQKYVTKMHGSWLMFGLLVFRFFHATLLRYSTLARQYALQLDHQDGVLPDDQIQVSNLPINTYLYVAYATIHSPKLCSSCARSN